MKIQIYLKYNDIAIILKLSHLIWLLNKTKCTNNYFYVTLEILLEEGIKIILTIKFIINSFYAKLIDRMLQVVIDIFEEIRYVFSLFHDNVVK